MSIINEKNLTDWVDPLMRNFERDFHLEREKGKIQYKGFSKLNPSQKIIARALLEVREREAEKQNLPPNKIIRNFLLKDLVEKGGVTFKKWMGLKALSSFARTKSFYEKIVAQLEKERDQMEVEHLDLKRQHRVEPKIFQKRLRLLENFKGELIKKGGEEATRVVLSNARMNEMAASGSLRKVDSFFLENFAFKSNGTKEMYLELFDQ